jgi:hypothetical protein
MPTKGRPGGGGRVWWPHPHRLRGDDDGAEIHLLDGGHFLLESQLDAAAGTIRRFLGRTLP